MPFTFVEIGLPDREDQGLEIKWQAPNGLKTARISGIAFFCNAIFQISGGTPYGLFLQMRKAPQNRPKNPQTVYTKPGQDNFLYPDLGRPCASASWRHFALCDCGATAQFWGVGDGPPHMAKARGFDSRFGSFSDAGCRRNQPV
jgi:hypothetical protein